jgi:hypothetical protein
MQYQQTAVLSLAPGATGDGVFLGCRVIVNLPCSCKLGSGRPVAREAGGRPLYAPACVVAEARERVRSKIHGIRSKTTTMTMMVLRFFSTSATAGGEDMAIQDSQLRGQHPARIPEHAWCRRKQQTLFQYMEGRWTLGWRWYLLLRVHSATRWPGDAFGRNVGLERRVGGCCVRWPACAYRRPWWCGRRDQEQQHERTPRSDCDSTQRNVR